MPGMARMPLMASWWINTAGRQTDVRRSEGGHRMAREAYKEAPARHQERVGERGCRGMVSPDAGFVVLSSFTARS